MLIPRRRVLAIAAERSILRFRCACSFLQYSTPSFESTPAEMLRVCLASVAVPKRGFAIKKQSRKLHSCQKPLQAFRSASTGGGFQPRPGSYASKPKTQPQPSVMDQEDEVSVEGTVVNDNDDFQEESSHSSPQFSASRETKYGDSTSSKPRGPAAPLLAVYRPNRDSVKGSAAQFSFAANRKSAYLSMAKQQGDKTAPGSTDRQFNWDNKLVFKLDAPDMSKILNILEGKTQAVDILHLSGGEHQQQRYTTLRMKPTQSGNGFYLSLQRAEGEQKQMISILIDETDTRTLQIFLAESIRLSLGFT